MECLVCKLGSRQAKMGSLLIQLLLRLICLNKWSQNYFRLDWNPGVSMQ
jgi:hypothetical protein